VSSTQNVLMLHLNGMGAWPGYIWLRIGTSGRRLWTR